jgi:AcrR family transcriptional regulator
MPATKDEIARKFSELAFRYGYRRTAVEDVARELHISKKTIYEFFPSKSDLLEYAIELGAGEQRRRVESLLTETTALGRMLQAVSIALADARRFFESSPHPDMVEPAEITTQVNARVFGPMVHDLVAEGIAAGEFDVPDPDLTTAFGMAVGMEAIRLIRDDPASRPEAAALDAIRRLVAAAPQT